MFRVILVLKKDKLKVLIVDDDLTITSLIESYLYIKDIDTVSVNSVYSAIQVLKQENFDIILSDVNMPDINGFEFLLWLKKNDIQSHIIIMTAQANEKAKEFYHNYGVVKYLSKPLDMSQLLATINQSVKSGFSGDIKEVTLFDYLQIMTLSRRSTVLSISSSLTELKAYLYFKDGELIDAEYGNQSGEEAFFKIIRINGGTISEIEKTIPEEVKIKIPVTALLFQATQMIDEENFKNKNNSERYTVLVVDDEPLTRMIIEKSLSKNQSIEATSVESAGEAAILLKEQFFNLVISDINMPDINGLEFLLWMKKNNINSKVIMMTSVGSLDIKTFAIDSGAIRYLEKPLDFNELHNIIEQDKNSGFTGNINEIGLFDYIQMISLSRKSKVISIKSPLTYSEGFIFFRNGNVVHAVFENTTGVDAFFKIMTISGGLISEVEATLIPENETIKLSIPSLLMKATGFIERENIKKTNIVIDDNIINSIDQKLDVISNRASRTIIPIQLPINNFVPRENIPEKNVFSLANMKKKQEDKNNIIEEESPFLKNFESLKYIVPKVSEKGEKAIKDLNTPISVYQLLKKIDGISNLEDIYKDNYNHLSINDFFNKFETVKNFISINPINTESLKINIFQILLYNKTISQVKLKESIDFYLSVPEHSTNDQVFRSGDFLVDLNLITFIDINTANIFVNKFNKFLVSFS